MAALSPFGSAAGISTRAIGRRGGNRNGSLPEARRHSPPEAAGAGAVIRLAPDRQRRRDLVRGFPPTAARRGHIPGGTRRGYKRKPLYGRPERRRPDPEARS